MPNQLPAPDAAYNTVFSNIYADAFFTRLASYGQQPLNEKEAQDYLELGGKLRQLDQHPQVKQASSRITNANTAIDQVMQWYGIKTASSNEAEISKLRYAETLAADPAIYNSVLSLKSAEALQVAACYGIKV